MTNGAPARFRAYPRKGVRLFEIEPCFIRSVASAHTGLAPLT
ncbi:hypothetical protein SSAG_03911 [Streptomyces sp. Mg1]|nr:hypothetical protein SSAG_03911 [Streptomyces sp. Mg1]